MAIATVVKGPSNKYFRDFEDACDSYFTKLFPDWKSSDKTYMFPPCFPSRYLAPTGDASGAVPLTKPEEIDIKGDLAELKIFRTLDRFGRQGKHPMFVFTKFEFKNFIENIRQRFPEDAQSPPEDTLQALWDNLSTVDLTREIDFLVVHKRLGMVLIEVKAVEKYKSNRHLDAKKQLQIGEQFVEALLRTTGISIPLYKVIAMPNVKDPGRDSDGYIDLRSKDLENENDMEAFKLWWRKNFSSSCLSEEKEQDIFRLVSILVGQRAAISATATILEDTVRTIDEQSFLARSYEKLKKKRKAAEGSLGVVKPAEIAGLHILVKQFMFLNPEQLSIWVGPYRQVFCGAPGSGKTILLQHKALECAKRSEIVVVIVPPPLDELYQQFFALNKVPKEKLIVVPITGLEKFISIGAKYMHHKKFHIFVDEFQVVLNTNQALLDSFMSFLGNNCDPQRYQWITYDVNQLPFEDNLFGIHRSPVSVTGFLLSLCQKLNYTHTSSLTTVMRCTTEIFDFLQQYLNWSFKGVSAERQKSSSEIVRHWGHPVYIGHHVSGPEVRIEGKITYTSREDRFSDCIKIIQEEINEWVKDGDNYFYTKLAVLVAAPVWIDGLKPYLKSKEIPVCSIGSTENAVTFDYMGYARSYEWPVVIAICGHLKDMANYIPSSRVMTRLVILWWK